VSIDAVRSRRALLTGAAGAVAATATAAVATPFFALAAGDDGSPINVGSNFGDVQSTTSLTNKTNAAAVLYLKNAGAGPSLIATNGGGTPFYPPDHTTIYGITHAGRAIYGVAGNSSGTAYGVSGDSSSTSGVGVYGHTTALLGATSGVVGQTESGSDNAQGVLGNATATSGFTNGVWGQNASSSGNGVYGYASSGTGYTGGVSGECASPAGVGVWGMSDANSTGTMGITGPSDPGPIDKTGVYGAATQPSAATRGVVGHALSLNGVGVTGVSGTPSLPTILGNIGVHGYSFGRGVFGQSGPTGVGVHGNAQGGKASVGVRGSTDAGTGVRGETTTGTAVLAATLGPKKGLALRASGRVQFDNAAGIATIAAGTSQVVVTPGTDLKATSAVVATLQGVAGSALVKYVQVNPTADTFTIHLTANAPNNVKVAWHVFG
jgi:hypothetical protein